MPQYQGVWNLQDAARLQSQQQWVTDPSFDYTTLLLQADNAPGGGQNNTFLDSSANAFTITRNGNTTQGTFTPFSATGWSNYFDGTGDYLSIANTAALNLGAGDLTVEGWIYMNALPSSNGAIASKFNASSPYTGWTLGVNTSGYPYIWFNTSYLIVSSSTVAIGQWHHLALVRSGSTVTLYVNGTSVGTATSSANIDNTGTFTSGIEAGNTNGVNGYISNVRVVKGTAVYTNNFNPSTIPLTNITNTSLLTCQSNRFVDNSTSPLTITINGTPSVQAFAPFAPQFQYTPTVIGGSGYFDGTGDYVSVVSYSGALGAGNYTIEFWCNTTDTSFEFIAPESNNVSAPFPALIVSSSTLLFQANYGFAGPISTSATKILDGGWHHVAVVRNSGTVTVYFDGVSQASASDSTNYSTYSGNLTVGYGNQGGGRIYLGYLSGLRIVSGTAVYTTGFTPPIAPPTAVSGTSLLLNFTNAAITDGTMKNNLETVGNAQVNTSIVKYGTGSMAFNGSSGYLFSNVNMPQFAFGTGNFTIEYWIYFNTTAQQGVIGFRPATTNGAYPNMYFISSSLKYVVNGVEVLASSSLSTGVWYHIAVSRSETSTRLFVNGVQQGSAYTDTTNYLASRLVVGADDYSIGTTVLNGYLDDLRITRFARYTANFTPPTVALPRQ